MSAHSYREALKELLRLYDWRFELARMERDGDCPGQMTTLLNQYGREKKAAWAVARDLLTNAASAGSTASPVLALEGQQGPLPADAAHVITGCGICGEEKPYENCAAKTGENGGCSLLLRLAGPSNGELVTTLEFARDALYNGFEPDNQSRAYQRVDEVLKRFAATTESKS